MGFHYKLYLRRIVQGKKNFINGFVSTDRLRLHWCPANGSVDDDFGWRVMVDHFRSERDGPRLRQWDAIEDRGSVRSDVRGAVCGHQHHVRRATTVGVSWEGGNAS